MSSSGLQRIPSIHKVNQQTLREGGRWSMKKLDDVFSEFEQKQSLFPPISSYPSNQSQATTYDMRRLLQDNHRKVVLETQFLRLRSAPLKAATGAVSRTFGADGAERTRTGQSLLIKSQSSLHKSSPEKRKFGRASSQLSHVSKKSPQSNARLLAAPSPGRSDADPKPVQEEKANPHVEEVEKLFQLATFALSAVLTEEQRNSLTSKVKLRHYKEKQVVFTSGESCPPQVYTAKVEDGLPTLAMRPSFYIVQSGEFLAFNKADVTSSRPFACLKRGSVFGELSFLMQDKRQCTIIASCDAAAVEVQLSDLVQTLVSPGNEAEEKKSEDVEEQKSSYHQERYLSLLKGTRSRKVRVQSCRKV
eukprot:762950-Hanusia_phi.AAC.3